MLVLRPREDAAADQNGEEGEGDEGSQSVARSVCHAGYATRGVLLAFTREAWHQ